MDSTIKIVVLTKLQRYIDAHFGAKHEAGYDRDNTFRVGCCN